MRQVEINYDEEKIEQEILERFPNLALILEQKEVIEINLGTQK